MEIESTLKERGKRYGEFEDHARISQALKNAMQCTKGWVCLDATKHEALEMIAHKIARILNGDPNYKDSWHDIAGYAKLAEDACTNSPSVDSCEDEPANHKWVIFNGTNTPDCDGICLDIIYRDGSIEYGYVNGPWPLPNTCAAYRIHGFKVPMQIPYTRSHWTSNDGYSTDFPHSVCTTVRYRNDLTETTLAPQDLRWARIGADSDIISYRVNN